MSNKYKEACEQFRQDNRNLQDTILFMQGQINYLRAQVKDLKDKLSQSITCPQDTCPVPGQDKVQDVDGNMAH